MHVGQEVPLAALCRDLHVDDLPLDVPPRPEDPLPGGALPQPDGPRWSEGATGPGPGLQRCGGILVTQILASISFRFRLNVPYYRLSLTLVSSCLPAGPRPPCAPAPQALKGNILLLFRF